MHNEIHVAALQELDRALADVLDVGGVRGDDVNHAEDSLLAGCVAVFVVVVVIVDVVVARVRVVACVTVGGWMGVRVGVWMVVCTMAMVVIVIVVVVVIVAVIVSTTSFMVVFLGVDFSVCSALIFKPELGNRISHHAAERA
jgi:hypothetical protein